MLTRVGLLNLAVLILNKYFYSDILIACLKKDLNTHIWTGLHCTSKVLVCNNLNGFLYIWIIIQYNFQAGSQPPLGINLLWHGLLHRLQFCSSFCFSPVLKFQNQNSPVSSFTHNSFLSWSCFKDSLINWGSCKIQSP